MNWSAMWRTVFKHLLKTVLLLILFTIKIQFYLIFKCKFYNSSIKYKLWVKNTYCSYKYGHHFNQHMTSCWSATWPCIKWPTVLCDLFFMVPLEGHIRQVWLYTYIYIYIYIYICEHEIWVSFPMTIIDSKCLCLYTIQMYKNVEVKI